MKGHRSLFMKVIVGLMALGLVCLAGCDPQIKNTCDSNDECNDKHLCNRENQCVEVEQKQLEIFTTKLDDAVVGKKYSYALSMRGGLEPYTWTKPNGPGWLMVESNPESGVWMLTGEPEGYHQDAIPVELKLTDSSIGGGQTVTSKNLSVRVMYCSTNQEVTETCLGHGDCNEGVCECRVGYAGNQCEECDWENGYELNDDNECIRYEYRCESNKICGANILKCECVGQECEDIENCELAVDCAETSACRASGQDYECDDCQGHGCMNGVCNECSDGVCCDNGRIQPETVVCDSWLEYTCSSASCGAHGMERQMNQMCNGETAGCDGDTVQKTDWYLKVSCDAEDLCDITDGLPVCRQCDYGCSNGKCLECDPASNGCCTSAGTLIAGCWYDQEMKLAWQDPPFENFEYWVGANKACEELVLGDKSDWRLPTISEHRSLIRGCPQTQVTPSSTGTCGVLDNCLAPSCWQRDCHGCDKLQGPGQDGCYWDPALQGNCTWYWTSSILEDGSHQVWLVHFTYGFILYYGRSNYAVRCVSSGP